MKKWLKRECLGVYDNIKKQVFNWNGKRDLDQCLSRSRAKENLVETVRII